MANENLSGALHEDRVASRLVTIDVQDEEGVTQKVSVLREPLIRLKAIQDGSRG